MRYESRKNFSFSEREVFEEFLNENLPKEFFLFKISQTKRFVQWKTFPWEKKKFLKKIFSQKLYFEEIKVKMKDKAIKILLKRKNGLMHRNFNKESIIFLNLRLVEILLNCGFFILIKRKNTWLEQKGWFEKWQYEWNKRWYFRK